MHRIFGIKHDVKYIDREGAYLIPIHNNRIGVVKTPKGLFLIGGGLEKNDQNHMDCIKRECLEETGYTVSIKDKICSAETFCNHPILGYFHPIQTYYIGDLIIKVVTPTDDDHQFLWLDYDFIKGKMCTEMQNWALEQCFNYGRIV